VQLAHSIKHPLLLLTHDTLSPFLAPYKSCETRPVWGGYRAINNMDDLYKNSTNICIFIIDMGFLSYNKIKTKPVELLLKVMRKRGEPIESLLKELREIFWE